MEFEEWFDKADLNQIPKDIRSITSFNSTKLLFKQAWQAGQKEIAKNRLPCVIHTLAYPRLKAIYCSKCLTEHLILKYEEKLKDKDRIIENLKKAPVPPSPKGDGILGD